MQHMDKLVPRELYMIMVIAVKIKGTAIPKSISIFGTSVVYNIISLHTGRCCGFGLKLFLTKLQGKGHHNPPFRGLPNVTLLLLKEQNEIAILGTYDKAYGTNQRPLYSSILFPLEPRCYI